MRSAGNFFRSSFGAALTGGLVVAVAGLIAIEAGWIEAEGDGGPGVSPISLARPASDDGPSVNEIYRRSDRGVVFISADRGEAETSSPFGIPQGGGTATGSGFVVDEDGHVLTNAHVVEGAESIEVRLGDDESHPAELVGSDPSTDLALLQVEDESLDPLPLGDASKISVGDPVIAIGNPFGLDRTVTTGIVSALQRQIRAPNGFTISNVVQTDAAINPGNSGGPLLDAAGRVIGINSQIATSGGGSEGVGFAVPINTAREVVTGLIEDGSVDRAYLGITGADVTPEIAEALDLPTEQGVLIEQAYEGGPADQAGVEGADREATMNGQTFPEGGDILIEIDGEAVSGMEDVINLVNSRSSGDEIALTVLRDGDERELTVTLGKRPAEVEDATGGN